MRFVLCVLHLTNGMLKRLSLGNLAIFIGLPLTIGGFAAYFLDNATLNLAGFFYGIPLLLGGLALKAAELKPIPFTQPSSESIVALREQQATATQKQLRQDVTRYRYGQSAHLDEALERLGMSPTDEDRPLLTGIHETDVNGNYVLVLEFDSPFIPLEVWQEKQKKMTSFFGPGIDVEVVQPAPKKIELNLIAVSPVASPEKD